MSNGHIANYNTVATAAPKSKTYASQVNSYYGTNSTNCVLLKDRYTSTLNALPTHSAAVTQHMINASISEFVRNNPNIKTWDDLHLAQSIYVNLADIYIDTTMQRILDLHWVAKLLAKFKSTKVVPIQIYKDPVTNKLCAWDGQHTAILLWIVCTQILKLDPATVKVPVNIYHSSKKSEMRECFLDLNSSAGKKSLDIIDHWIQQVFGVRIDKSTNPQWVLTENKQKILEKYDMFVTHDKFNNEHMPGAITRIQELNSIDDLNTVKWLVEYLSITTMGNRPAIEKEVVMMAYFFNRCRLENIRVDSDYVKKVASTMLVLCNSDFSPNGPFWAQAKVAYDAWHNAQPYNFGVEPKLSKEPVHGFPFLLAQLAKSIPGISLPRNNSNSNFMPATADLF